MTDEQLLYFINDKLSNVYFGYLEVSNGAAIFNAAVSERMSMREFLEGIYDRSISRNYLGHFDPTGPTGGRQ